MPAIAFHRESYIVRVSLEPADAEEGALWHIRGEIEDVSTREIWRFGSLEALTRAIERRIQQQVDGRGPGAQGDQSGYGGQADPSDRQPPTHD